MLIFLDTETTGLADPRLVELAFAELGHVPIVVRVKPPKGIELDASVVNGIRDKDVAHLPLFKDHSQYEWIKSHLEGNTVVAHNASFDIGVLANEGIFVKDYIDTKSLATKAWPNAPRHRLQHLRYWLDLEVEGEAHTAAGDVMVLMALWNALHSSSSTDASPRASEQAAPLPAQKRRTSVRLPKEWKRKNASKKRRAP